MKRIIHLLITVLLIVSLSVPSFAGVWKSDTKGWWYLQDDGSWPSNGWFNIQGKDYYFNADGYLLVNTTTPDGYKVDANGEKVAKAATTSAPTKSEPTANTLSYILNTNTKKFHRPSCGSVKQMKEKNKKSFSGTRDQAINNGYVPCKNCKP